MGGAWTRRHTYFGAVESIVGRFSKAVVMSDNWLILIPKDPNKIPEDSRLKNVQKILLEILPKSNEIQILTTNNIKW